MERLRIAHCSDIHLDCDGAPQGAAAGAREHHRGAFRRALDRMIAHRPDLMLIAGDLFDSNAATPDTVRWAMETLASLPVPVAMIPGNHDCLEPEAVFRRHDFSRLPNVSVLLAEAGETAFIEELEVAVWGKGMIDHHPGFRPLAGCPARPHGARWYLGMGHGIFVPRGESTGRSSPIRMEEIDESPCDYLALGHHHAALELDGSTPAAYSGSPTDSVGRGATYVIVDFEHREGFRLEVQVIEDYLG